jgi:hypothetical protein
MTTQELAHDTLIALQIAYDGTDAQDDVRMLISGYRALRTRYREAVKVLETIAEGTEEQWVHDAINDFLAGKVTE